MAGSAAGLTPVPTGPALPRPVLICALLALAGHAALLGLSTDSGGKDHAVPSGDPARSLHFNLVAPTPVVPVPVAEPEAALEAPATAPAPAATQPAAAQPSQPAEADSTPPSFEDAPPKLSFPDAALPETGVQVRVHVRIEENGQIQEIATAVLPTDAPAAFEKLGRRAVADARFTASDATRGHCLQLDFKPDQRTPTWSWRTDGATRCLTNPDDNAQALPAR